MSTSSTTLRARIAEAQGIAVENCTCAGGLVKRDAKTKRHLPDYENSLDACAQFEAGLTKEQREIYVDFLIDPTSGQCSEWDACSASPHKRCLAYLATINPQGGK